MKQTLTKFRMHLLETASRYLVLITAIFLLGFNANAQTNIQIGTGTLSTGIGPIYSCYSNSYTQSIFSAAELTAAGASPGQLITKVRWFYTTGGTNWSWYNNWTIRMGTTGQNIFSTTSSWIPAAGMTIVYSNTFAAPPTNSWVEFNLTTPFLWTGGNLCIAVDENAGVNGQWSCTANWRYWTTGGASTDYTHMYYYSDVTNPNPVSPPAATGRSKTRPQIQLQLNSTSPCSGTPSPGNTLASAPAVCAGNSVTLTLQNSTSGSGVSYQWQNGPSSTGPWANFGTNAPGQSITPVSAVWYRCIVSCSGGGSGTSNPVQVGLSPFTSCYCASAATVTADEEIYSVTVNGNTNALGCGVTAPGPGSQAYMYSNFHPNGSLTTVQQFQNVAFTVVENECDGPTYYPFGTAIFIDYNQNGVFTDAGEKVFVENTTATGPRNVVGSFIIPGTATPGVTGMRIIVAEGYSGASLTPCLSYGYGETEDYLITIVTAPPCSAPPAAGTASANQSSVCSGTQVTLTASGFGTGIGMTYQWESAPSATGPWAAMPGLTAPSVITAGVTAPTYYRYAVTCSGNTQVTNTLFVNLVTAQAICGTFCASAATQTADEEIFNVTVGTLNNTSLCNVTAPGPGSIANRYSNFTGLAAPSLQSGLSHPFSLTLGYCGSFAYSNTAAIYVDFNQNGSFTDAGENVWTKPYGPVTFPSQVVSGSFTIPGTATPGLCRMRIVIVESSVVSPCGTYTWGETEDYVINVFTPPCTGTPAVATTNASPASSCPSNANSDLTMTGYSVGFSGISHQWMSSSTSGGPYTVIPGATGTTYSASSLPIGATYFVCQTTCANSGLSSTSSESSVIIVNPVLNSTAGATRCGYGTVDLSATANAGLAINWYNAPTGGTNLGTGTTFTTPNIATTTTYYAAAVTGGGTGGTAIPLPPHGSTFTGNTRGYFFTAPVAFTMTGLQVPTLTGNQSIAVIRFNPAVPPPVYASTTNAFDVLYLTQNNATAGMITVNIQINAGDVIGILGSRGTSNSYGTGPYVSNIAGYPVTLARMGMQFTLNTTAPQQIWQEIGANISRVEFTYSLGCEGTRVPVVANVTPAPPISIAASAALVCAGNPVNLTASSSNDPNYSYVWTSSPSGYNASGDNVVANPTVNTTFNLTATDNTTGPNAGCVAIGSVGVNTSVNNVSLSATVTPASGVCPGYDAQLSSSANEGTYCLPTYAVWACDAGSQDYIDLVNFAGIYNVTTCTGSLPNNFQFFSSQNANVVAGISYPMSVSITPSWGQGIRVWIDFNQNQLYEATELMYSNTGVAGTTFAFNVTIPAGALNGTTRMRVRCTYNSIPTDPCALYTYGDCEDYPVTISGGAPAPPSGFTYLWTGGSNLSATNITNPVAQAMATTTTYTVTATSSATGCIKTQNVLVNVKPVPNVSTLPINAVCEGDAMTVSASDYSLYPSTSFSWTGPNSYYASTAVNGGILNVVSQGIIGMHDGMYQVVGTNAFGCTDTAYTNWILNPNPVPYVVTGSLDSVSCPGFSDGAFQIAINSGTPYPVGNPWNLESVSNILGTIVSGSSTNSPILGNFINLPEDNYDIIVGDFNSCEGEMSVFVPTEMNEAPEFVSGPSNITANNDLTECGANVSWTVPSWIDDCPGTTMAQTGGFANGAQFPIGTTTVTYVVTDAQGATDTHVFTVTVNDTEAPTVSSCPANFDYCNPIVWTPPTFSDNCPGLVVVPSHTPGSTFGPGNTTVTYTATDVYGNVSSCSFVVTRLEESVAADTVISNRSFHNICIGENITMTATGGSLGAGADWKWYNNASGSGTPLYTGAAYTTQPTVTTTYYVRAEGTCNTTAMEAITVNVSTSGPGTVSILSAPAVGALGQTAVLTVAPVVGAQYYQYTSNLGHISALLFNGQVGPYQTTSNSVNVTFQQSLQNYQIRVIALNACGRSNTASAHIRGTVAQGTSIVASTGNLVACPGQLISYTGAPISGSNLYTWSIIPASTGTITSGQGGLTIDVTWAAGFSGSAQLCYHGQTTFNMAGPDYCVTISTNAPTPGAITGNAAPCQGGTGTYSIAPVAGATGYNWSNTVGASIIPSGTSASITFPAGTFAGDICVTASTTCGVSAASCLPVTSGAPGLPGDITGPTSGICDITGISYFLLTSDANSYLWTTSDPSISVASGNGSNSVLVDFLPGFTSGSITVEAIYDCGSSFETINVDGKPGVPSVTPADLCMGTPTVYFATSTGATSFTWMPSGQVAGSELCLNGTCSQFYIEWDWFGPYMEVTASNSCGTSDPFNSWNYCRLSNETQSVEVYPNPTSGKATIEFGSQTESDYSLKVTDLAGRVVFQQDVAAVRGLNQVELDLSFAGKGMYLVNLTNADGSKVTKRLAVE